MQYLDNSFHFFDRFIPFGVAGSTVEPIPAVNSLEKSAVRVQKCCFCSMGSTRSASWSHTDVTCYSFSSRRRRSGICLVQANGDRLFSSGQSLLYVIRLQTLHYSLLLNFSEIKMFPSPAGEFHIRQTLHFCHRLTKNSSNNWKQNQTFDFYVEET